MNAQIIEKDGQPEWADIPYSDYVRLLNMAEDLEDIRAADEARLAVDAGEETLPLDLVRRLSDGEGPLRTWREYRGLSVADLASATGLDEAVLLRLEAGSTPVPPDLRPVLSKRLGIDPDDLASWGQD